MFISFDLKDLFFIEMCEGFFENVRSFVEYRFLMKLDFFGYCIEKFEEKKYRIKGKIV